jgi:hypothetical protein
MNEEINSWLCKECGCTATPGSECHPKPKRPYTKRSPYWRITLKQRIKAAYRAFRMGK